MDWTRGASRKQNDLGLFEKFEKAKEEGLINHIGFSFHDTLPVFKEIVDYYPWDMAQIQYNYMDTGFQATTDGLKYAHEKGLATVIMEPLKGGKLANPPKEALDLMKGSGIDRTPVDWALQFLWDKPEVSCVISGMGSEQMVDENCASADNSGIGSLSEKDNEVIQKVADIYREKILVLCTACYYCMPCPAGVDIPGNFVTLNNVAMETGWLNTFRDRRKYNSFEKDPKKIDPEKPNGNASVCITCGQCLDKCPQHIQIPDELVKVDAILGKGRKISDYH